MIVKKIILLYIWACVLVSGEEFTAHPEELEPEVLIYTSIPFFSPEARIWEAWEKQIFIGKKWKKIDGNCINFNFHDVLEPCAIEGFSKNYIDYSCLFVQCAVKDWFFANDTFNPKKLEEMIDYNPPSDEKRVTPLILKHYARCVKLYKGRDPKTCRKNAEFIKCHINTPCRICNAYRGGRPSL